MQCKGYEMRGSAHTSSCVLAGKNGRPLLESENYEIDIFTEKIFTTPKSIFSTRIIRESDHLLHIILSNIHFFELQPSKHY